jgi:hypothetical protein
LTRPPRKGPGFFHKLDALFFFGSLFVKCSGTDRQDPQAMEKFSRLTGVAAPLPVVNIDTDMIIPKDYLKTIKRTGLGKSCSRNALQ